MAFEVWAGDGMDEHLVLATDSFAEAYGTAGAFGTVVWLVRPADNICEPLPVYA